jgi:hypothetical protein
MTEGSGWVTTDVAAKAVRVSPRTVRRYIERGELEAKPQGEGVRREWLVSVDSLHVLRASRTETATRPRDVRDEDLADGVADVLRELAARLEERTAEAVEYRIRLELTERAHSTAEEERRRLLGDLDRERGRADRAEEEARRLRGLLEAPQEPRDGYETEGNGSGEVESQDDGGGPREDARRRSWWRTWFGFE